MLTLDDITNISASLLDPTPVTGILALLLCSYSANARQWLPPQPWHPLFLYATISYICFAYVLLIVQKLDGWLVDADADGLERGGVLRLGGDGGGRQKRRKRKRKRTVLWRNEVVLVTGGLGGLGREIVEGCVRKGARVAVVDVAGVEAGEEVCAKMRAESGGFGDGGRLDLLQKQQRQQGRLRYYRCDVGRGEEIRQLKANVEETLGPPTILINNAGITNSKPLLELSAEEVDRTFRINTLAHFHTIRAFLPGMLEAPRGGTIVTVASVLGYLGCAGLSDYTASKAAVIAMHTSLRAELDISTFLSDTSSSPTSTSTSAVSPPSPIALILATPGHLQTPLFSHVPPPPLSSFLGPQIPPRLLAENIIEAIESGKREVRIAQPLYARWIAWIEVLPLGVRRLVRWVGGVDWAGWEGVLAKKRGQAAGSAGAK